MPRTRRCPQCTSVNPDNIATCRKCGARMDGPAPPASPGGNRTVPAGSQYCPTCGTVAPPRSFTKGSFVYELALWICFLLPGVLYSIWRLTSRTKGCPACRSTMIPLDSPKARAQCGYGSAGKAS